MVFRHTGQEPSYTTKREIGPGGQLSTTHEAIGTGDGSDFSGGEVLSILLIYAGRSAPSGDPWEHLTPPLRLGDRLLGGRR